MKFTLYHQLPRFFFFVLGALPIWKDVTAVFEIRRGPGTPQVDIVQRRRHLSRTNWHAGLTP